MRRAFSIHKRGGRMSNLDPETLTVETFVPGPEEGAWAAAAQCTGCMSTCGILPP
jgi:hypothetical protein